VLVLETLETAEARGAASYAEIAAVSNIFDPDSALTYRLREESVAGAIHEALRASNIVPADIGLIAPWSAAERRRASFESPESRALEAIFGDRLASIPQLSLRPLLGECFSAMGLLQLAGMLGVAARTPQVASGLVNNFSRIGTYASLVATNIAQQAS
jgi:3-oxoacyl-(acyl-carrier-protein) synthase